MHKDKKTKRALVVANGDNKASYLQSIYKSYDLIIAADGAANVLHQAGIRPDIMVGDFDSVDSEVFIRFESQNIEIIRLKAEKDYSDTHVALNIGINEGAGIIDLAGGFGSRWDHSIANLNLLYYCHEKGVELRLISEDNTAMLRGEGDFFLPFKSDSYISVFALFEDAVVSLENLKYKLNSRALKRGESLGLSNEYQGDGRVIVSKGSVLLVESKKD